MPGRLVMGYAVASVLVQTTQVQRNLDCQWDGEVLSFCLQATQMALLFVFNSTSSLLPDFKPRDFPLITRPTTPGNALSTPSALDDSLERSILPSPSCPRLLLRDTNRLLSFLVLPLLCCFLIRQDPFAFYSITPSCSPRPHVSSPHPHSCIPHSCTPLTHVYPSEKKSCSMKKLFDLTSVSVYSGLSPERPCPAVA